MARRRNFKGKRKFYRKGRKGLAAKVAKLTRMVKVIKPEIKHFDTYATVLPDNNPTVALTPYRNIIQSTGDFQGRIGDKIGMKSFRIRTSWLLTAGAVGRRCRMIAFTYKYNPDAVTSTLSTIINLYLASSTLNSASAPLAFVDWDNKGSFTTLYDKSRMINNTSDLTSPNIKWDFTIKFPPASRTVNYVNNGSTISRNELFIFFMQELDTGISVDYNYRMEYYDA